MDQLRQRLRMRGLRSHVMYTHNGTRLHALPLLASRSQALRYKERFTTHTLFFPYNSFLSDLKSEVRLKTTFIRTLNFMLVHVWEDFL